MMYKKSILRLLFATICGVLLLSSFDSPADDAVYTVEKKQVEMHYHDLIEVSTRAFNEWLVTARLLDSRRISLKQAKSKFAETRKTYKTVEFLVAYLEEEDVEEFVNGAPFPTVDNAAKNLKINPPCGLQTIEKQLFSDTINTRKIVLLSQKLIIDFQEIAERQERQLLDEPIILEAARLNIVCAATLGISGGDTPESGNAIEETDVSVSSMFATILPYIAAYLRKDEANATKLILLMQQTHDYLSRHPDFDSFDRLKFIHDFANPLFAALLTMQKTLGIEVSPSTLAQETAVNLLSTNIFAPDFLNKSFFTNLKIADSRQEVADLGKLLFFDPLLSDNNRRACASCHDPKLGFGDGKRKSIAFDLETTVPRNAPTVVNSVYAKKWFDDLRVSSMEAQIKGVVTSEKEFHSNYADILKKITKSAEYRRLFRAAFGKNGITEARIATAIVAYEQRLTALNSPFDRYMRGEISSLPPDVVRGFNIFAGSGKCATCHFAPTFSGLVPPDFHESESEVLGVPLADEDKATLDPDLGRFNNALPKENAPHYKYAFKTPTVRNVEYTAPYMHNGVFKTLEDVLIFYNRGGGANIGIDLPNRTLSDNPLRLPPDERNDVIAFLNSLSDTTGITAPPRRLPKIGNDKILNERIIGGRY